MKQNKQSQANNPHPKQASNIQVNKLHFSTEYNIKIYIGLLIIFILFISIIFSIKSNVSASNQSPSNDNLDITNSYRNMWPTNPMAPELNSNGAVGAVINGNNNLNDNKLYSVQIAPIASALKETNINHTRPYDILHNADSYNVNLHIKSRTLNLKAQEVNSFYVINSELFGIYLIYINSVLKLILYTLRATLSSLNQTLFLHLSPCNYCCKLSPCLFY